MEVKEFNKEKCIANKDQCWGTLPICRKCPLFAFRKKVPQVPFENLAWRFFFLK